MIFNQAFNLLVIVQFSTAALIFILLRFLSAPYGKHNRKGWGLTIKSKYAWLIMELPAVFIFLIVFVLNIENIGIMSVVFLVIWETHYIYRTFIFSQFIKGSKKTFPVIIVVFSLLFNIINGYINSYFLFVINYDLEVTWLIKPVFIAGLFLFIIGLSMNISSDKIIFKLRSPGETLYRIPKDGFFKYVSNPNYLGEIIEWGGWAILTWSLPGLAFAVFTFANLVPRAISNHKWYHRNFPDYPEKRKIIIPKIY